MTHNSVKVSHLPTMQGGEDYDTYGDSIYISLMNQYTPMPGMTTPLDRKVTNAEYSELVSYAERLGVVNAFIQEGGTQKESFIPDFEV